MYQIVRTISFCIRAWLCYKTIDNIPIFENYLLNNMILEILSLYVILMIISRSIVGIVYNRGEAPVIGSLLYFIVYVVCLFILYGIMLFLTKVGILPF